MKIIISVVAPQSFVITSDDPQAKLEIPDRLRGKLTQTLMYLSMANASHGPVVVIDPSGKDRAVLSPQ